MDEIHDEDAGSSDNISSVFQNWSLSDEEAISLNKNYILKMCGSRSNKLCFITSDSTSHVYLHQETKLKKIRKYNVENVKMSDVKFSPANDHLLYTSSIDGCIRLWDERIGSKCVSLYQESPETREFIKPILSFDVSCNDRVLCGGTETSEGDAFMLFWDIRKSDLLGAYWNSHTDDIVQVQFSESKSDQLITAGLDGLINIFDISEMGEDDALQYSLNTECAVDKLCRVSDDTVACITDNVDVQLWNIDTADQIGIYSREDITKAMKRKVVDDCYVADVFTASSDDITILGGSYSETGKCLRSVCVNTEKKKLTSQSNYEGNKQIVRCCHYDSKNDVLFTGGESGILSLWKKGSATNTTPSKAQSRKSKISTEIEKLKIHKGKPY